MIKLVQIKGPGLKVKSPIRSYAQPQIAAALAAAGAVLAAKGESVVIGDASTALGGIFPPHKSHQAGLDVDVASSTEPVAALDPVVVNFLEVVEKASGGAIRTIFARDRKLLDTAGLPVSEDDVHIKHVHVRFNAPPGTEEEASATPLRSWIIRGLWAVLLVTGLVLVVRVARAGSSSRSATKRASIELADLDLSDLRAFYRYRRGQAASPRATREELLEAITAEEDWPADLEAWQEERADRVREAAEAAEEGGEE